MKFTTSVAALALAAAAHAIPADEIEKRATCTFFGFEFPCAGGSAPTSTAPPSGPSGSAPSGSAPASSAPATPTGGGGGGSSTGGSSSYSGGSSANDITDGNGCTPLTVIFARGTSEPGNVGYVAGPPMFEQLIDDLGASGVTLQGVPYAASAAGNANCGADGGSDMADLVQQALSNCPNTKIALSGYSQGACVVHNAASSLDASSISSVVLFGDPFNGQSVGDVPDSNVLEICRSDDSICNRGPSSGSGGHTSYGSSAQEAATFIENH